MMLLMYSFFLFSLSVVSFLISLFMFLLNKIIIFEWMIYMMNSMKFSFIIMIDFNSMLFLSIVLIISSMIMIYSINYMISDKNFKQFKYLMFMFIISMCLMIMSPSIMSILLGWDLLGLVSYCLIIFYQNYNSMNSGNLTMICNRIGDIGLILLICWSSKMGSWNLMLYKFDFMSLFFLIFSVITKSAQMPFSSWLPAAMTAPTPISSLVHSSTLVTAGIYLFMRYYFMFNLININNTLLFISTLTMLMASIMANIEFDLKKIIALSTLSQLGLMMSIMVLKFYELSFFHLIIHALFKSLMFMCAGMLIHSSLNNQDVRKYGNMFKFNITLMLIMFSSLMNLSGLFFISGFFSKDLIIEFYFNIKMNYFTIFMFYISMTLTISYTTRLTLYLLKNESNYSKYSLIEPNFLMKFSLTIMTTLTIFSGIMLFNMFFNKLMILLNFYQKLMIFKIYLIGIIMGSMFYLYNFKNYLKSMIMISQMFFLINLKKISYIKTMKIMFYYNEYIEKSILESLTGLFLMKISFLFKLNFMKKMNIIQLLMFYLIMIFLTI